MRKELLIAGLSLAAMRALVQPMVDRPVHAATTVFRYQGFELGDSWTIAAGAGNISTATGTSDVPAHQRIVYGTHSWQLNNGFATLDLSSVPVSGYSSVYVNFRVTSVSSSASNGADASDYVRAFVALNGADFALNAGPSSPEVSLIGNTNALWGYNASLVGLVTAGQNIQRQAPQSGNNTLNYDDFTIFIPKGTASVALRIVAQNDDPNEMWCIDDISMGGTIVPAATWDANGGAAGTGGSGTWDLSNARFNDGGLVWSNTVNGPDTPVYFGGTAGDVTLGTAISANALTFGVNGYKLLGNALTLTGTAATVNVTNSGDVATIGSQLTGAAGLFKTGAGKLILNGASNNYTGTTNVTAGQLVVNGTHSGAGNYVIGSGARLGGTGSINLAAGNSVSVGAGATLAPGDATGRLTVNGDVTFSVPTATLEVTIAGPSSDPANYSQLKITGNGSDLGLNGASLNVLGLEDTYPRWSDVTLSSLDTFDPETAYKIIDVASGASYIQLNNLFNKLNGAPGSTIFNDGSHSYRVFYFDNDGVYVQFGNVPEPAAMSLIGIGAVGMLRRRRTA